MKARTIYVDVDDTLVRSVGVKRVPMPGVVDAVSQLQAAVATMYLWSSGGADYSAQSARELGIEDCFIGFLPKPDASIDDQSVAEWRYCRHVLPANAAET